jgi:hypothetical protein
MRKRKKEAGRRGKGRFLRLYPKRLASPSSLFLPFRSFMATYTGNPRITIDSEADWTRIKDNFTSALLAQIDAKLDPDEDEDTREKLKEELVRRCMQVSINHTR